MSEGRLFYLGRGCRVGQEVLQGNANRRALHLRIGIIQPGEDLLLPIRLLHQALEQQSRVQHLRVVYRPRLLLEQGAQSA